MLVQKGDCLVKNRNSEIEFYEVLLADKKLFCVGKMMYDTAKKEMYTSCGDVEVYSNDENIGCLQEYGFMKAQKESEE